MSAKREVVTQKQEKKYLDAIFWGGAFLWAGIVFGLDTLGYLPEIGEAIEWNWIFLGVGIYGLFLDLVRLVSSSISNPNAWDWIWAIVFTVIGAAGFFSVDVPWWLFLILIGLVILFNAIFQRG